MSDRRRPGCISSIIAALLVVWTYNAMQSGSYLTAVILIALLICFWL